MSLAGAPRFCIRGVRYVPVCAGVLFCARSLEGCPRQVIRGRCIVSLASGRRMSMRGVWYVLNLCGLFNQSTSANICSALVRAHTTGTCISATCSLVLS